MHFHFSVTQTEFYVMKQEKRNKAFYCRRQNMQVLSALSYKIIPGRVAGDRGVLTAELQFWFIHAV